MPIPPETQLTYSLDDPVIVQPCPDDLIDAVVDHAPGPDARYEMREAVGLAFIIALQRLPPLQRVALVLRDVLGFRTVEVADMLDTTQASIKGALQRARVALDVELPRYDPEGMPVPNSDRERAVTSRFVDAIERGDVELIVAVLSDDARLQRPTEGIEFRGRRTIAERLRRRASPLRVLVTRANSQPALACYRPDHHGPIAQAYGLMVLTVRDDMVSAVTWFPDTAVFPMFGLPRSIAT